jgi:hypothetical protein
LNTTLEGASLTLKSAPEVASVQLMPGITVFVGVGVDFVVGVVGLLFVHEPNIKQKKIIIAQMIFFIHSPPE